MSPRPDPSRRRCLAQVTQVALGLLAPAGLSLAYAGETAPPADPGLPRLALSAWSGGTRPGWAATDLEGHAFALEPLLGRVVVLNFWASYCAPCRLEMPSFAVLAERWRQAGRGDALALLSVNHGEMPARATQFLKQTPWPGTALLDRSGTLLGQWGSQALPTTFVLDPAGRPRYVHRGELDWGSDEVDRQLQVLLRA